MELIGLVVVFIFCITAICFINMIPTGPSVCPNCKKEYEKAEEWSFTEYSWGLRCPHCKYEFDITP